MPFCRKTAATFRLPSLLVLLCASVTWASAAPDVVPKDGPTNRFGDDNAMVRAGIHGQYVEKDFKFKASLLKKWTNTIILDQRVGGTMMINVMYDCIRLEVPF
jgi:hypothetical protein